MTLILPRRRLILGAAALLAAPAIVRYSSLMKVKPVDFESIHGWINDPLFSYESDFSPKYMIVSKSFMASLERAIGS